jgi:hypothetical protein
MDIYFEKLSLISFIVGLIKFNNVVSFLKKKIKTIYFVDCSWLSKMFIIPLLNFFIGKVDRLNFKMVNIKDDEGELVRTRIHRVDLFGIQKEIIDSISYKHLYDDTWSQDRVIEYINKGLLQGSITETNSISRILYLINVVHWHSNSHTLFIVNSRAWFKVLKKYALRYDVQLINSEVQRLDILRLKEFVVKFPNVYAMLINIKYRSLFSFEKYAKNNKIDNSIKLYIDGRGDIECNNNGYHSDFFMCLNSSLSLNNVLYKSHTKKEFKYLEKYGVKSVYESGVFRWGYRRNYIKPKIHYSYKYKREYSLIKSLIDSYDLERFNWSIFFKKNNVKIYTSWFKYSNKHMAISDAIKDNGGVATIWQMAFDGFQNFENTICTDIQYVFSKFDLTLNKILKNKTQIDYICGYPKAYAAKLVSNEAQEIRDYLRSNGAKKIIFCIDENSIDDSRWHTGHKLQQENYSCILREVLKKPWLGVVFKPKNYLNLRKRLGDVNNLLMQAESTGRCYVYKKSGRHTTSAPPILAGLSADVCIHGHLNAGTAALECAIEGIPTLLVDREGAPFSVFYKMGQDNIIFKNWDSALESAIKYFQHPDSVSKFGSWYKFTADIGLYNNFTHNIGDNLDEILGLYNKGHERDKILKYLKNNREAGR